MYVLYSTKDYKIRYVGSTKDIHHRFYRHIHQYRNENNPKCLWVRDSLRNGYEVRFKIIHHCLNKEDSEDKEVKLILHMQNKGYNLLNCVCGKGLANASEELRKRLSLKRIGITLSKETIVKMKLSMKGRASPMKSKRHSNETRLKLSLSHIGKPSKRTKRVLEYSKDGGLLAVYESITEAAKANKCGISNIANCLTGRTKSSNNKIYKYAYKD